MWVPYVNIGGQWTSHMEGHDEHFGEIFDGPRDLPPTDGLQAILSLMKYICLHEEKTSLWLQVLPSSPCLTLNTSNKHSDRRP